MIRDRLEYFLVDERLVAERAKIFATLNSDGFDEPSASGGSAVLTILIPSLTASRQQSGPKPVVQWVCSSTGMPSALAKTMGTSVCTRSGVSRPPGSFKHNRFTFNDAAWRVRSAKYSSVCFGETE